MTLEILSAPWFSALASIIVIDLILAGDNALVIGLAARNVPAAMQKRVILWGTAGAIIVRALEEPLRQLAYNAGLEGSVVVDKVRSAKKGHGLDVDTTEVVDLVARPGVAGAVGQLQRGVLDGHPAAQCRYPVDAGFDGLVGGQ